MDFKINDLQGIIGAQNISRKILKITTTYKVLFNSEIGRSFTDVFFVCFWSALCLLKNVIFFFFLRIHVYHIVFKS